MTNLDEDILEDDDELLIEDEDELVTEEDDEDFEDTEDIEDENRHPVQVGLDVMMDNLSYKDYTMVRKRIKLSEIALSKPLKVGRATTIVGLTKTVRELGVLNPIHVLATDNEDDDFKYDLLDGARRVFASLKNNFTEIEAIVWDFKDKDKGNDLKLALALLLNRQQKRTMKEIWELYKILEIDSPIAPNTAEYLLQLESGDAMKLKDVMLSNYEEPKELLMSGEKDLESCYKLLAKLRKEEDQLSIDDNTGFSDTIEQAEEFKTTNNSISDEDALELLEMIDRMDDDPVTSEDFSELNQSAYGDEEQKVGERHPLDPQLRQTVLIRDDFTCKCCGLKMIGVRLGLIAVHHKIPVHVGGKDTEQNLTTLCVNCHVILHIMERNGGQILMREEDYNQLLPSEQTALKRALKLARAAIEANKRKGLSRSSIEEATRSSIKHPMPGTGLKENMTAYNNSKA